VGCGIDDYGRLGGAEPDGRLAGAEDNSGQADDSRSTQRRPGVGFTFSAGQQVCASIGFHTTKSC
jgi:hypothetical protein